MTLLGPLVGAVLAAPLIAVWRLLLDGYPCGEA